MSKELKNVRLLTSGIVTCLHPNQAVPEGTVFTPEDFGTAGTDEANYLVLNKMAERTSDAANFGGKTLDSGKTHVSGIKENDDATLKTILLGTVEQVKEHIDSKAYTVEQIKRLGELNLSDAKPREGVAKAVEAFIAENEKPAE